MRVTPKPHSTMPVMIVAEDRVMSTGHKQGRRCIGRNDVLDQSRRQDGGDGCGRALGAGDREGNELPRAITAAMTLAEMKVAAMP